MSYTRHFQASITVSGSKTVSYPKSESGGSMTVNYSETEPLDFYIEVDTNPVDHGVSEMHGQIAGLNAAVVAGAQQQIREKRAGADKISTTVITEFSNYITGDIKQEMASLKSAIASRQALLHAEGQAAGARHQQFIGDYRRIKERYATLFHNLDKELERRVRAIDEPVFRLVQDSFLQGIKNRSGTALRSSLLGVSESGAARQALENTGVKRRNLQLLQLAGEFLLGQKELEHRIAAILTPDECEDATVLSVPVVLLETEDSTGRKSHERHAADSPPLETGQAAWDLADWGTMSETARESLDKAFLELVGEDSAHLSERELGLIQQLWSDCRPLTNDERGTTWTN
ncbi:MAG: hypothetical protein WCG80_02980 [Spirochaetales bacterium]